MLRLVLIGFGNVGSGLIEILANPPAEFSQLLGGEVTVVAVSDPRFGSVYEPQGFSPEQLLSALAEGSFESLPALHNGWSSQQLIEEADANVVVDLTPTNMRTGGVALDHARLAFASGKSFVTTNKGPVAVAASELFAAAESRGLYFGVEGTVMAGTPVLQASRECLKLAGIKGIRGILNGTTNYVLGLMEEGQDLDGAVAQAQCQGYAETDPSGDVEGVDAAGKLVILSNLIAGVSISLDDVDTEGISGMTTDSIHEASEQGGRVKLIAELECQEGRVRARVAPQVLPGSDPLASVQGAANAITWSTELLGDVTMVGPGAGRVETAYAVASDLLTMVKQASLSKLKQPVAEVTQK